MKDLAGDAFVMLINVFNDQSVEHVSEKFMGKLIAAMEHIDEEETLNALISILVVICACVEKKRQKIILYGTEE